MLLGDPCPLRGLSMSRYGFLAEEHRRSGQGGGGPCGHAQAIARLCLLANLPGPSTRQRPAAHPGPVR